MFPLSANTFAKEDHESAPTPPRVSAGPRLTAQARELLPPSPGIIGHIGPENEHGAEDRHDPAVPGVPGKRERLTRRSLDERVEEPAHHGPDEAQYHRHEQAHALPAWEQEAGNQPDDQPT